MDGRPLPDATIRFIPQGFRTAMGRTDAEGKYEMLYSASARGAIVGDVRVEITTANPDNLKQFPETVPAKYNRDSTLTANVESGSNVVDFDLASK